DRRVLAVDVVADLGLGHRAAHRRRGPRDRVAPEVDAAGAGAAHAAPARTGAASGTAAAPGAHGATSASQAVNASRPSSYMRSRRSRFPSPRRFSTSGTRPQFAFIGWKPSGFAEDR